MLKQSRNRANPDAKLVLALLLALLVFMSSAGYASALGVSPGRTTVDFEPGLEKTVSFTISNDEHKAFDAYVYVEGDLRDYITFDQDRLSFSESDNSKGFTFRVKLPEKLDPPGDHWAKIVVLELPSGLAESQGKMQVTGTVAVVHQLKVKVPFPGKYAQLYLSIDEAEPNGTARFYVRINNLGKEDLQDVRATIDIVGPNNERIASLEAGPVSVPSMDEGKLAADWKADVRPGEYHASAIVSYGEEVTRLGKNFQVGSMLVDVLDISVKDFRLGGIAKFDILAESVWNKPIQGIYADMNVRDSQGRGVADFRSATADVEAYGTTHLYAYWDTEGVQEGEYGTQLVLHYAGLSTEREVITHVALGSIRTEIVGISVGAITAEEAAPEQNIITVLVVAIIVINLSWFLYFRRRRR
jgi:hypothetical protein